MLNIRAEAFPCLSEDGTVSPEISVLPVFTQGPAHRQFSRRLFDEATLVGVGAGPPLSPSGKRPLSRGPSPCTVRRSGLCDLA